MKPVKHINDGAGAALCKKTARTGEERENENRKLIRMGGVDSINLVTIDYELQLGLNGVLCRNCIKKWKEKNL